MGGKHRDLPEIGIDTHWFVWIGTKPVVQHFPCSVNILLLGSGDGNLEGLLRIDDWDIILRAAERIQDQNC